MSASTSSLSAATRTYWLHETPTGPLAPAPQKALDEVCNKLDANSWEKEWNKIQSRTGANSTIISKTPSASAQLPENQSKNRYVDVLPFDSNRVVLHPNEYINASLVKADDEEARQGNAWHFIATQGPHPGTAADFWRMVMEQNTKQIVMLTRTMEVNVRGAPVDKCCCYFPVKIGECQQYGELRVQLMDISRPNPDLILRSFSVTSEVVNETWEVQQFQYIDWPNQCAVTRGNGRLLDLIRRLEATGAVDMDKGEPPIIHCNTGSGRTGVFIALAVTLRRLAQMPDNFTAWVSDIVCMLDLVMDLRRQRMGFVSNQQQYVMLHEAIRDWLLASSD